MSKPRIFVIFKNDDINYMNELLAKDANKEFDFVYEATIPRVGIHTADGKLVKNELTDKIKACTHLLCLIGKDTANNDWINWQVQTASVTGRKVIAARAEIHYKSPAALLNFGATWAKAFTFDAIKTAIAVGESSSLPVAAMPAGEVNPDGFG